MTSSSASESTWRTLYGSMASGIGRSHPDRAQRSGQCLRLLRREPTEQVADHVAEGGGDRQGQDRTEQPREGTADDDREDDRRRVELDRVALDLGHEEVVLDLLDQEVQEQ